MYLLSVRKPVRKRLPILSAISATRSPQIPLMAMSTLSPGSTVLNTAHSIAACPEPLIAIVMLFSVWKAYWIPFLMSFMICDTKWKLEIISSLICQEWSLLTLRWAVRNYAQAHVLRIHLVFCLKKKITMKKRQRNFWSELFVCQKQLKIKNFNLKKQF